MKTSPPDLAVRAVCAVIPGLGAGGRPFGELVPTAELLAKIRPHHPGSGNLVPDTWVAEHLGIRSVAVTRDTLAMCRRIWSARPAHTVESAFAVSQSDFNDSLYTMLRQAAGRVAGELVAERPRARVVAHIHICGSSHQFIEGELRDVRRGTGIDDPTVCTLILQQGCAGVLVALEVADALLGAAGPDDHVLVTAENNMMYSAHLRACHTAPTNQDFNHWLWPAIFGEGVGAMVVGRPDREPSGTRPRWTIDALGYESMACDTPVVAPVRDKDGFGFKVVLQARQVRQNYLRGVAKHAAAGLEKSGGLARLHRLCLHESNPLLVREMALRLDVPPASVPTFSADTGTLAGVSVFALLEAAMAAPPAAGKTHIVCSLIGEAGGHLIAGHLCLRRDEMC